VPDLFFDRERSLLLCREFLAWSVSSPELRGNLYKVAHFPVYFLSISIRSLSVLVLGLSDHITGEFPGILNLLGTFDRSFAVQLFLSRYRVTKLFLVIRGSGFVYYFCLN
jgi:hypothetical protein